MRYESTGEWKDQSVLATGNWVKVEVEESGMHRLSYEQLSAMGLSNPAMVRVYGTGGRALPELFSQGYCDDLEPVPVHMDKGGDGMFSPGDFILFYAEGPVAWSYNDTDGFFSHKLHDYSWKGHYFITDGQGTVMEPADAVTGGQANREVTTADFRLFLEEERYNLISSGRQWLGDEYYVNLEYNYPFELPPLAEGGDLSIRVATAAQSNVTSNMLVRAGGTFLGSLSHAPVDVGSHTGLQATENFKTFNYDGASGNLTVSVEYDRPDSDSKAWLDYITINGRRPLALGNLDQLDFRDRLSVAGAAVSTFRLGSGNGSVIWDISDPGNPLRVPYETEGQTAVFTLATPELREFIAFRPDGDFPSPVYEGGGLGPVANQDLHGMTHPDMIILTTELLMEEAERLAEHRRTNDGLTVKVVLQEQVFNEFSSGTPDVSAIRNFMKMFYDRSAGGGQGSDCRYLLLFGDGSFDNRSHPDRSENPNLLLTYQSVNSLAPTRSYVSDDYFGLLDTDESMYSGLLDIGIGRFPVTTVEEARDLVDKLIAYDDPSMQGSWRNVLCFIGDDEDSNIHMRQADELASYVNEIYPAYNINKIYMDAYPQVKGATGFTYPAVERAINDQVNRGALIVNYTGHGGPDGLAHEQVITRNSIASWSNMDRLPLFMTATCEFSRYDEYDPKQNVEITSAGEEVLLSTVGGGIGLFTTTRLVYSGPNHTLNEKFYEIVFEKDARGKSHRLGDIIAYSKNNTGAGINKRNFTLLGDPSMQLAYPEHRVITDSINEGPLGSGPDTLSAFDWVTVSGHLESNEGTLMGDFNGTVYPTVFDKERVVQTLNNDPTPEWSFLRRDGILYSGKATVTGGRFSFGFYVPKDISYAFGSGKISYYSHDSIMDAHGSTEDFEVGGIGSENVVDLVPPTIRLFMNDTFFVNGGITDASPTLLVLAEDNYGINTTGNGIGHDITATLDGDRSSALILNDFFQANTDSHNSGSLRYPYSGLEKGKHEISVKVWDIHNNSADSTISFLVVDSEEMLIEELFNYPNPFSDFTLFSIEHNRPDREMRLVIRIYDLNGALVRLIDRQIYSPGYRLEPPRWDGRSEGGGTLGAGVYVYSATLSTSEGEEATAGGKLVLVH